MNSTLARVIGTAARNAWALSFGQGVEAPHATPSTVIHDAEHEVLRRFGEPAGRPVLLVPPLAAPATCFDLHKGHSVAEFLLASGRTPYLVDYGRIGFADRNLGIEHWIDEIIPNAIRRTSEAAGGRYVDVVSWSIGGTLTLLAAAANTALPLRSVTAVGSPIDYSKLTLLRPWRMLGTITKGEPVTTINRIVGGIPSVGVRIGFRATALGRELAKPAFIVKNLHNTETLARMSAVERFMASMPGYPGRFYGQLHGRLMLGNDLAGGTLKLGARRVHLSQVKVPVLLVAGTTDTITPAAAARAGVDVLTGAPSVRYESTPGSHLGILTGPEARATTWRYLDEFLTEQDKLN